MLNLSELPWNTKIMSTTMGTYYAGDVQCDIKHYLGGCWYVKEEYTNEEGTTQYLIGEQVNLSK